MRNRLLLIAGLVLIAGSVVGMIFAGGGRETGVSTRWGQMDDHMGPRGHMWQEPDDSTGRAAVPGARDVVVRTNDYAFQPATVTVPAGRDFNLTLENQGRVPHDLTVPALGIHVVAAPGQSTTISIAALAPGRYRMLCSVPGHAAAGMTGTFVVEATS